MIDNTLCIRPLAAADEPLVHEMVYQAIFVPDGQPAPDRSILRLPQLAQYSEGFGRAGDRGFVAIISDDDQPEAAIGAAWLRLLPGGYGYIDDATPELSIAILPQYRGRGLGSALLERLLVAADGRYPAISLSVQADNPAVRLYRRFGFTVFAAKGNELIMRRPLPLSAEVGR